MKLTREALAAYDRGVTDGTISDTVAEIIETLVGNAFDYEGQDIVSYCSANGTYSFDGSDIIMGDE